MLPSKNASASFPDVALKLAGPKTPDLHDHGKELEVHGETLKMTHGKALQDHGTGLDKPPVTGKSVLFTPRTKASLSMANSSTSAGAHVAPSQTKVILGA